MIATDTLIDDLTQLSDLDFSKRRLDPTSERCIEITLEATGVRKRLPAAVLHHYDQRISRGKRGAARMRNTTCGGCNLALPSGQLADLRHAGADLQLCCNCSIYLLPSLPPVVDPDAAPVVAKPAAKKVAVKKPRKAKAKDETVLAPQEESDADAEAEIEADAEVEVEAENEAAAETSPPAEKDAEGEKSSLEKE